MNIKSGVYLRVYAKQQAVTMLMHVNLVPHVQLRRKNLVDRENNNVTYPKYGVFKLVLLLKRIKMIHRV